MVHSEVTTRVGSPCDGDSMAPTRQARSHVPQPVQPDSTIGRRIWTLASRPSSAPKGQRYRHQNLSAKAFSDRTARNTAARATVCEKCGCKTGSTMPRTWSSSQVTANRVGVHRTSADSAAVTA